MTLPHALWTDNNLGRSGEGRNPYWLSAGIEAGGEILWSAPEIILYDRYHSLPEAGGEGSDSRLGLWLLPWL